MLTWGNSSIAAAADTRYLAPGFDDSTAPGGGEVREWAAPRAGTMRNMFVRNNNAPGGANANAVDYFLRVNGVDTALTVSRAANAAVGQSSDLVDSVAIVQGDRIAVVATKAADIGSGLLRVLVSVLFDE